MERDTRALTGIRGVAALWVMASHFYGPIGWMPARHLVAKGYLAVDLFFVLSGFVIALNHGDVFARDPLPGARSAFYRRRLERVYPLFLGVVLLSLAISAVTGRLLPSLPDLAANLTMTQAWFSRPGIVGPSWSVSVEAFAYLLFPTVAAFAFRGRPGALVATIAAAWGGLLCMTATGAAYVGDPDPSGPLDVTFGSGLPILRCLCGFVAGVCAYRLAWVPTIRIGLSARGLPEVLFAVIVGLAWLTDLDVLIAALFVPLICALSVPGHAASRALRSRPALYLGDLSYAIYLVQGVVGLFVAEALVGRVASIWVPLAAVSASLAAAVAMHEGFEKPCHALLAALRNRGRGKAAIAA